MDEPPSDELQMILDAMPLMFFQKDTTNRILRANQAAADAVGTTVEALVGSRTTQWFPDEAGDYYKDDLEVMISSKPRLGIIEKLQVEGPEKHWIRTDKFPHFDENGKVDGILVFIQDATAASIAEDALSKSEERLRTITEKSYDVILETTPAGEILYASTSLEQVLGYEPHDVIGRNILEFVPEQEPFLSEQDAETADSIEGNIHPPGPAHHQDGTLRWVESTSRPYESDGEIHIVMVMRDVTDRLNSEESERAAKDRFSALTKNSRDVIVELDPDAKLSYVSPNVNAVLGIEVEELVGLDLATIATKFETSPIEQVQGASGPLTLSELIARGPYQNVRSMRGPEGQIRWIETVAQEYETSDGQLRAIAIVRDITGRIQLEEQLLQSEKFESMGVLARGVAHGFNNLLTSVLGNVELAIAEIENNNSDGLLPLLWETVAAASRAAGLADQLSTYAGKGTFEMYPLDLSDQIHSERGLLKAVAESGVQINFELRKWLPAIEADASQLRQILLNLVLNAVDACGELGGEVVVSTGTVVLEENSADAIRSGVPPGTYVYFAVRDDGEGISEEVRQKIFDPFFTAKIRGSGLGLATSLSVARAHGGTILLDSTPGRGSTFKVLIPASGRHADPTPSPVSDELKSEGLILVVDDEDSVCQLLRVGLARFGYTVLTATSGEEAIAIFTERAKDIDLLLTDLAMPGMNGEEIITQIRMTSPHLPTLIMSGYGRSSLSEELAKLDSVGFVQKPFLLTELAAAVRRTLHTAASVKSEDWQG